MKLVIMGPQGSGKGTQAMLLANKLRIPHISMGDMLRAEIKNKNAVGERVKEFVELGKLVPDELNEQIVEQVLLPLEKGFLLDGFPRTMPQAKFLDSKQRLDRIILLKISDDEAVRRMTMRRYCPKCGANYNLAYVKTHVEGTCDHCHTELAQRDDDKPALIRRRLKLYHEQTEPLIQHYEASGKLMSVDGERPIKDVFADVLRRLRTKT
jgi:adenylate kinase